MAQRYFELSTVVPVSPEEAIDFLTDLRRHKGLHPYLAEAQVVEEGDSVDGHWQQWRVHERPRLGPIRYSIRFGARLTRTSPTSFTSWVLVAPGCTIEAGTVATESSTPGASVVDERAMVRAPGLLLGYMASQAELAHTRTFTRLPEALSL